MTSMCRYISDVHTSPKNFIDYIVDDDFTFSFKSVVNIVGIAGQGKSTVLRKLFVNSFNKSNKFPFFIELRKLRQLTIFDYLRQHLEDIGVRVKSEVIDGFLSSGRVVIYLDGFDELKSEDRQEIINQIKSLNTKYDICIVVTSRPHTEICNEPFIENFELLTLKKMKFVRLSISCLNIKLKPRNALMLLTITFLFPPRLLIY
ncbi:NACHT domain-containing protein [Vibrio metschnikovii]|uniref:NACHT domain-containing protein n=1 Tax=Vibrio metschnikovii TaxID=28172 RepID=UPI0035573A7F